MSRCIFGLEYPRLTVPADKLSLYFVDGLSLPQATASSALPKCGTSSTFHSPGCGGEVDDLVFVETLRGREIERYGVDVGDPGPLVLHDF